MSFLLENVVFSYPKPASLVLQNLNFELHDGQKIAMLGRSGLGKTTLLNLLALLWDRELSGGKITYRSPLTKREATYGKKVSFAERARLRRDEFGLVPQVSHFLSGFTCKQNLSIPLAMHGLGEERLECLLDGNVAGDDMRKTLHKLPPKVSTGQRQRLSVLRAVLHDPVVLFADEPVSNLDDENRDRMLALFSLWHSGDLARRWQDGKSSLKSKAETPRTLILICHEAETAWAMADQFLFLHPEASNAGGAVAELIDRAAFCRDCAVDLATPDAAARGAEAIRRRIRSGGSGATSPGDVK